MTNLEQQNVVPDRSPTPRWRVFLMPGVVCGLLGGHVVFVAIAITLATGDRSFAVVPDYYQKAVDWDQRRDELAASDELGWRVELRPSGTVDALGQRNLALAVHDAAGQPVAGAAVTVEFFHHARAKDFRDIELSEVVPGQYAAAAQMPLAGRWQFDIVIERGEQRYVATLQQHVPSGEGEE